MHRFNDIRLAITLHYYAGIQNGSTKHNKRILYFTHMALATLSTRESGYQA